LFVDVSTIMRHDARTGIQRVVRAVWSELSRRNGQGFLLQPVFATKRHGFCCAPHDFLRGECSERQAQPVAVLAGDRFLGLDLSAHLLPHYRRQLRAWKSDGVSIHLMVYDLLPIIRPEWFNASTVSNFRRWLQVLMSETDQAICISDQVAHDLRRLLGRRHSESPAIARMKMGADIAASVPSTGVSLDVSELLERLRFRPALLMVGTVEPRKGYDVALAAFEWLWENRPNEAPDLVIVGRPGWKTPALQRKLLMHPRRGVHLHWLTGVSDEALSRLYAASAGVFIASHAEGFGLPLIEAAMFRRHVLARDLPEFREQRIPDITFFNDDRPSALAPRLIELASRGRVGPATAVDLPTWSQCVEGLLRTIGVSHEPDTGAESPLRIAS